MSPTSTGNPATVAVEASARQPNNTAKFFKRIFELFWLIVATLAALFFFKVIES